MNITKPLQFLKMDARYINACNTIFCILQIVHTFNLKIKLLTLFHVNVIYTSISRESGRDFLFGFAFILCLKFKTN